MIIITYQYKRKYHITMEKIIQLGEDEKEIAIQKRTDEIRKFYNQAQNKEDLDFILKKFSLKYIKNQKKRSPMALKMDIKAKIILMAIDEPEDMFDYDYWLASCQTNP